MPILYECSPWLPTGVENLWRHSGVFSHSVSEGEDNSLVKGKIILCIANLYRHPGNYHVYLSVESRLVRAVTWLVLMFQNVGIPYRCGLLNFVALTAALSAINSDMFSSGRMLHDMAEQGASLRIFRRIGAGDDNGDAGGSSIFKLPYAAGNVFLMIALPAVFPAHGCGS